MQNDTPQLHKRKEKKAEAQEAKHYNRLINEKSPYLIQHADNPVDWYPWGEEAFAMARRQNKPIFLSIGYSTCHWCHVMEHESFEDIEVARLMNEVFVSIKVDREERPDIDKIYMSVCQMMTGSGGWPLTIIMTPDKKPFFAATYIPRQTRFGHTGLLQLIPRIRDAWTARRDKIISSSNQIASLLSSKGNEVSDENIGLAIFNRAFEQLEQRFDHTFGGFGSAPKFPTAHNLFFLMRYWGRTGSEQALLMVEKTLKAMHDGGIYDHVGFGFHRYATDREWIVPHFEKMLYDQAMLAMAYTEAFQITGREEYKETAQQIFTYVLRDMTAPEGGFYSAEDADSEGIEGKFYLWTEKEIRAALKKDEADLVINIFGIKPSGNLSEGHTDANILYLKKSIPEVASETGITLDTLQKKIERARQKLFTVRKGRIHPSKDDKILVDWNGLMIAALSKAAKAFDRTEYAEAGKRAADFILTNMFSSTDRLCHRYREGEAAIEANLDDYVFFIWGLIELYEATFEVKYIKLALQLNATLMRHFWDKKNWGFYFTADDSEQLIARQKEVYDGATPSGNSVAMLNLLRLSRITANTALEQNAMRLGRALAKSVEALPSAFTQLLSAVDFGFGPSYEVVIAGDPQAQDTVAMVHALREPFLPNKVVILRPATEKPPAIINIAPYTKEMVSIGGKATAYVCLNYACKLPVTDIKEMVVLLDNRQAYKKTD